MDSFTFFHVSQCFMQKVQGNVLSSEITNSKEIQRDLDNIDQIKTQQVNNQSQIHKDDQPIRSHKKMATEMDNEVCCQEKNLQEAQEVQKSLHMVHQDKKSTTCEMSLERTNRVTQTLMHRNPSQGCKTQKMKDASLTDLIESLVQRIKTLEARSVEQYRQNNISEKPRAQGNYFIDEIKSN